MGETGGSVLNQEQMVGLEVVNALRTMTDTVLAEAGVSPDDESMPPVILFRITKPGRPYSLKIYSIADGVGGFNTSTILLTDQDNLQRWSVYIDRGTQFGAAFDHKVLFTNMAGMNRLRSGRAVTI